MNTTRRTIAKNASSLMIAQIITWGLTMILTVFLSRYLGAANLGKLQLATSIWAIMSIFISFGTEILLTKEIARNPERTAELTSTSTLIRSIFFLVCLGIIIVYAKIAGYPQDTVQIIYLVGVSGLIYRVAETFQSALQGLERMEYYSLSDVLSKALNTVITIVLLLMGYGVMMVAFILILSSLVSLGIQFYAVRKFQPLKFEINWEKARWMLKAGFPYLLVSGFLAVYTQIDVVILSLILNEESIGWYGAASRLFGTLLFVPTVFITAVFPALSRMYKDGSDNLTKLLQKSFDLLLLLSIPIGLGVLVMAQPVVLLLYGEEFANSGPILATMGIVIIFTYQNALLGRYFISIDRQNAWTVVMGVATLSTIPLDLIFIPWFETHFGNGAIGGSISFMLTEAGMLLAGLVLLPRGTLGWHNVWFAARALLAGAAMVGVAWLLRYTFILFPIAAGAVCYFVLILIFKVIPQEDWALLNAMAQSVIGRFRKPKSELPA